jgi:hypothetical protein
MDDTCQVFISTERPKCGDPAVGTVKVTGQFVTATVPVCKLHQRRYNDKFARLRTSTKA